MFHHVSGGIWRGELYAALEVSDWTQWSSCSFTCGPGVASFGAMVDHGEDVL